MNLGNKFCIELWAYPYSYNGYHPALFSSNRNIFDQSKWSIFTIYQQHMYWSGKGGFDIYNAAVSSTYYCIFFSGLTLNSWSHISANINNSKSSIYINGIYCGDTTLADNIAGLPYLNFLNIGGDPIDNGSGRETMSKFTGCMRDFAILKDFNRTANFTPSFGISGENYLDVSGIDIFGIK